MCFDCGNHWAVAGCATPQGRVNYTASGALAGGATGAVLGSLARNPGAGAVIGGATGAILGGLIGHGIDEDQAARLKAESPQTLHRIEQGKPLTVTDVESLSKANISDDIIISQIQNTRTVYHLTAADIIALKHAGVSDKVVNFMINTPTQISSAQVADATSSEPPPPRTEVIVPSPGPGFIWMDGSWLWFGGHWVWHHGYWHRPYYHRYHHHGRRW